jgi:hypothetical protein
MDFDKMTEPTCTLDFEPRPLSDSKTTKVVLLGAASKPQFLEASERTLQSFVSGHEFR